jgi:hypothetical protein
MSLTPVTPNLSQNVKSFWSRPEGKVGMILLALVTGGALFFLMPFIVLLLTDTLHAAFLAAVLIGIGLFLFTDNKLRNLISFVYKSGVRYLTGLFIELDPIGILKSIIQELRAQLQEMGLQIGKLRGSITNLDNTIKKNKEEADENFKMAKVAQQQCDSINQTAEPEKYLSKRASVATCSRHATSLMKTNEQLTALRSKLKNVYDMLIRWQIVADAQVTDKENIVAEETQKRAALKSAYSAYRSAVNILKGNPNTNDMYDSTLEFLAMDSSNMLGEMEDFNRMASSLMDNMDLKSEVDQQEAMKQLEVFEQKLIPTSTGGTTIPAATSVQVEAVPLKVKGKSSNYSDFMQ